MIIWMNVTRNTTKVTDKKNLGTSIFLDKNFGDCMKAFITNFSPKISSRWKRFIKFLDSWKTQYLT